MPQPLLAVLLPLTLTLTSTLLLKLPLPSSPRLASRDLLPSTLRKAVKAMGGEVRIVAEFPDRAPVVLSELSEEDRPRKAHRRHARARS